MSCEAIVGGTEDGVVTVWIRGEIDLATASTVVDAMVAVAESGTVTEVVMDLSGVAFMDSSGLAALIRGTRALADRQVVVVLGETSPQVQLLLEVTGAGDLFTSGQSSAS